MTDENGAASIQDLVIPDTITSWIVTGFGVSGQTGFGVANQTSILAFQDFFIKLRLPYSIKQGEDFVLQAVVYNYLSNSAKTTVTLKENELFDVELGSTETVTIPTMDAYTVTWVIKAKFSGVIPINVRAVVDGNLAGDQIERLLIVKPEGIPQAIYSNALLTGDDSLDQEVSFPENTVDGSKRVEVRLFGDALANTIENIDQLLKMPYGCGEQNMYNFAPAVFILDYLKKTNALTPEIEAKALKIIETGYQREMQYQHASGGYSAFGENSYSKTQASTVLTSFVLKCYTAANRLLDSDIIDKKMLDKDMNWFLNKFTPGGLVQEDGKVFSSQLMGGLDKDGELAITAYSAIVLAENFETLDDRSKGILDTVQQKMASRIDNSVSDHTLAMICYCLHLTKHSSAKVALDEIMSRATQKAGYVQWMVGNKWSGESEANVEIAAYVLLSYSLRTEESAQNDALPVFVGIQREMSETGGFSTTQDTVIGIQAMSAYAVNLGAGDKISLAVSLQAYDDQGQLVKTLSDGLQVTNENKMIVQIENVELKDSVSNLRLESNGAGTVYVQVVQHFYIPSTAIEPFSVEVVVSENDPAVKRKRRETTESKVSRKFYFVNNSFKDFCLDINAVSNSDETGSGMSLVMVEHPSGYTYKSHSGMTSRHYNHYMYFRTRW